jgi:hypothetical protein
MKRILILCAFVLSAGFAIGQTTVPTIAIIISKASAERLYLGTDTADDRENLRKAISLTRGIEIKPNPCHRPSSNLINEGRLPNNCTNSQENQ